ncbi:MAG: aldehyde dehydrogenase family protein [Thermomicrobiales bacterium]
MERRQQRPSAAHSATAARSAARTRLFLDKGQYDSFMNLIVDQTEDFKVGDPMAEDTLMGPVISDAQWERVNAYVEIGRNEGAELVYGGTRPSAMNDSYFYQPTIFARASTTCASLGEEIFGPV